MDIIVNFLLCIFFTLIDAYIVLLFLKNKLEKLTIRHDIKIFIFYFMLILSNWYLLKNQPIGIIFYILSLFILIYKTQLNSFKLTLLFTIYRCLSIIFSIPLYEWFFDIPISTIQMNKYIFSFIFIGILCRYIMFCFILISINRMIKLPIKEFKLFKVTSMLTSLLFCLNIIIYNDKLFYFNNIGRTFILVVCIYNTMLIFFNKYQTKHELIERELAIINQNISNEKDYIIKHQKSKETIKELQHDLKNNFTIIYGYLNNEDIESAKKYIDKVMGKINDCYSIEHVGYPCVDSIIDDKINIMRYKKINYQENIVPVYLGNIDVEDFALLIGLALDNAIEATEKLKENRNIELEIRNKKNILVLNIRNTIPPDSHPCFNKSSKKDKNNHGYGVKKIQYFANLYDGEAKYTIDNDSVFTHIKLKIE